AASPAGAYLSGVSCTSSSACTAVGSSSAGTLAEAWNGSSWSIQPTPNPNRGRSPVLSAVSCGSASDCMAVGQYYDSSATQLTLAEAWNGSSWSITAKSNPKTAAYSYPSGVSCTPGGRCASVGSYNDTSSSEATLAEAWDGSSWSLQPTPNPRGFQHVYLNGVSCTSASACTGVGGAVDTSYFGLAERWNGASWSVQPT